MTMNVYGRGMRRIRAHETAESIMTSEWCRAGENVLVAGLVIRQCFCLQNVAIGNRQPRTARVDHFIQRMG